MSLLLDPYAFYLTRRHPDKGDIAFWDGHFESLTLRELTLPVAKVHRRWHYGGNPRLENLRHRDADN